MGAMDLVGFDPGCAYPVYPHREPGLQGAGSGTHFGTGLLACAHPTFKLGRLEEFHER